jgi:hydrogenase expression/formation protein HypC
MEVLSVNAGFAQVQGRGEQRRVKTALLDGCVPGQWVLVFLEDAREIISAQRALEVNATLDMLQAVMDPNSDVAVSQEPVFALPSDMDADALKRLTGQV